MGWRRRPGSPLKRRTCLHLTQRLACVHGANEQGEISRPALTPQCMPILLGAFSCSWSREESEGGRVHTERKPRPQQGGGCGDEKEGLDSRGVLPGGPPRPTDSCGRRVRFSGLKSKTNSICPSAPAPLTSREIPSHWISTLPLGEGNVSVSSHHVQCQGRTTVSLLCSDVSSRSSAHVEFLGNHV